MKRLLWPFLLALLIGLVGPVPVVTTPAAASPLAPAITGPSNFRDAAGSGLALADGGTMATGVVYRSSRLYDLTADDIAQLEAIGVTDIYDLRTSGVAAAAPDPAIAGATYHLVNLFAGHSLSSARVRTAAQARAYMRSMNRRFVTVAAQRRALAGLLRSIAAGSGPVVVHCTEGKDRTGWVSAMLQVVAGASREDIYREYLLSNTYRAADIQRALAAASTTRLPVVREVQVLRSSYLRAGLDAARHRYHSLHRYLTRGLGLTSNELAALRARLHA